jgi:transporter family-2 protein
MPAKGVALALTVAAGGFVALQAPINSRLGRAVGTYPAAVISFAVGLAVLLVILAVAGTGGASGHRHIAWWYLLGGVLGAFYVSTVLVTVRTLGAGGLTAATITGQLTMSVLIDRFGWFGVERHPITATRLGGIALLGAGVFLIVRD